MILSGETKQKRVGKLIFGLWKRRFISDPRTIRSVFIGGGTPGLLKVEEMKRLCSLVRQTGLASGCEWTVEIASEISHAKLECLAEMGVNRISLGVQTFDDSLWTHWEKSHP